MYFVFGFNMSTLFLLLNLRNSFQEVLWILLVDSFLEAYKVSIISHEIA